MVTRIQLRRDSAANWTSTNPILDQGEPGYETDTGNMKIGDGYSRWSILSYAAGPSGPANAFSLSTASNVTLGGIKIGSGLSINNDTGVASVSTASISTVGGVKVGSGISISSDGTISLPAATTSSYGSYRLGPVISVSQLNTQTVQSPYLTNVSVIVYDTVNFQSLPNVASYNTSTGVFIPGIPGYYQVNASVSVDAAPMYGYSTSTSIGIGIVKNPISDAPDNLLASLVDFNLIGAITSGTVTTPLVSSIVQITQPSDTIQAIVAIQVADGSNHSFKTIGGSTYFSVMSISFLRDL